MESEFYNIIRDIAYLFLSILFEGAPFIFVGTLISGFIDAYLPPGLIDRWLPRKRVPAIMMSGLLGAVFPVCECAVVPVIRRLIQKGLPVACAVTYMLSAPIINPIVVASTLSAFSGDAAVFMTSSRLLIAYIVTVFVGIVVSRFRAEQILGSRVQAGLAASAKKVEAEGHKHDHDHEHGHDHPHEHASVGDSRLVLAMRSAMHDFLDTGMYFSMGVMITAVFDVMVVQTEFAAIAGNDLISIVMLMGLGFVLSLCSTSDAFIIAQMGVFSYASRLAFLVFGPMMDVKLVFMYLSVFKRNFVIGLAFGLFILIGAICLAWSLV